MDGFNGIVIFIMEKEEKTTKDRLIDGEKRPDQIVDLEEH